jgi:hypothetical protein
MIFTIVSLSIAQLCTVGSDFSMLKEATNRFRESNHKFLVDDLRTGGRFVAEKKGSDIVCVRVCAAGLSVTRYKSMGKRLRACRRTALLNKQYKKLKIRTGPQAK